MGVEELSENIVVRARPLKVRQQAVSPLTVRKTKGDRTLRINIQSYDPRIARIETLEAPVLRERGFKPVDESLATWKGKYNGYPAQIFFQPEYPAVPFQWHWNRVPDGFGNVVGSQLCIEALLDRNAWTPEMTVETVFEGLDSHPYFRR